jgi:secreted trypsin-like serine protease
MRRSTSILVWGLLLSGCSGGGQPSEDVDGVSAAIHNGNPVANKAADGVVGLAHVKAGSTTGEFGTGILLNDDWVLTAAHVADEAADDPSSMLVALGDETVKASRIRLHPMYDASRNKEISNDNIDVALVRLEKHFSSSFRRNISRLSTKDMVGKGTRLIGFGKTNLVTNPARWCRVAI